MGNVGSGKWGDGRWEMGEQFLCVAGKMGKFQLKPQYPNTPIP
ncbi:MULTISPECIES: hypothetical protein [unclassified Microcystis]|nr:MULTISPECIES: hypothetical protein [unclassified Microcystis]